MNKLRTLKFRLTTTFILVSRVIYAQDNASENFEQTVKNYFKFDYAIFLNETKLQVNQDYIFGSGSAFGAMYQRQIMNNNQGSLFGNIGFGSTSIGHLSLVENQGVKENLIANENYLLITFGFTESLKEKKYLLGHIDLEVLFTYWIQTNFNQTTMVNTEFSQGHSSLSLMFSPHYVKTFKKARLGFGPFTSINLFEFNRTGNTFELILVGFKMGLGIGF